MTLIFLLVTFTTLACPSAAIKVLMLPALAKSHMNYFVPISTALSEAGHEAYIVLPEDYPAPAELKEGGGKVLMYKSPPDVSFVAREETLAQAVLDNSLEHHGQPSKLSPVVVQTLSKECDLLLTDEDLNRKASELKPDVTLVDGLFFVRCYYMFAARLRVPYVTLTTFQDPWHVRLPALPSVVPSQLTGYSDLMTFSERLYNTFIHVMWASRTSTPLSEKVTKMYPPDIVEDYDYLITRSAMWFYNSDIVMNYPKPSMPNVVDIGGICIRPVKPLPSDLQKFMDDSKEGVIILSFGSVLPDLPPEINGKFISAFRKLRQSVLWRINKPESLDLPPNVRTLKWLPQQDLLAHPNTKLLITHCGNNGQFEAMNYKVPMIGFPISGDQTFNAKRMEYKGYGKRLDILRFTPEQLTEIIDSVLNNKSFSENLERASQIFHDRPDNPRTRAVYWLEHVVKYGGAHMRSSAFDLPWYMFLMIDILGIAFLLIVTFVISCFACVRFALRLGRRMSASVKLKST